MSKRTFFLGFISGIMLSILLFFLFPLINQSLPKLLTVKGNSTQDFVQEFADTLIDGDYNTIWDTYGVKDNTCGQGVLYDDVNYFRDFGLSTIYDHVPIKFIKSEQITQAMESSSVSLLEKWCAYYIVKSDERVVDYPLYITVMECNGVKSILYVGASGILCN